MAMMYRRDLLTVHTDGKQANPKDGKDVEATSMVQTTFRVIRYAEVWLNKAEALARRNQGADRAGSS